jgi:N-acetylmuramoyl-L-alanine amidase
MKIKQDLITSDRYSIKAPYSMKPIGICVHNTANDASAKNEISYMKRNNNKVSFHMAVDDKEAIQGIPFNRNAWHAGDGGQGTGNRKYIAIEICYSKSGGNRFIQAEKNAAEVIAQLLKERGWGIEDVKRHYDFSGKNCPHRTMELGWGRFLSMVKANLLPAPVSSQLYRVRKSWEDTRSQIGAFSYLDNAKAVADINPGYFVFDEAGKVVYPEQTSETLYRVRKSWSDVKSQIGAYKVLDNAIAKCKDHLGYSVYDEAGKAVYASPVAPAEPKPEPEPKPDPGPQPEPQPEPEQKKGTPIQGASVATVEQMVEFVYQAGKTPRLECSLEELAELFLEEGRAEGIKGDMAFAQAVKETNYFTFLRPDGTPSLVLPAQNNYAGIGATNNSDIGKGAWFDTPREGVRAQIQHLKAYASTEPLEQECVDPRFKLVTRGLASRWEDLNGRWAVPGVGYGESIVDIHRRILETQVAAPEGPPQQDDFEGFEKIVRLLFEKLLGWLKRLLKSE